MATTIDQKVVEMRFDNSDFERNTRQTMSTLEKLKNALHFKGASDGLDKISDSARKIKMDGLANGIQEVSAKFSALEIIGTTALVNLTNSAVNAGKQIVKSISIDQVTSGLSKMEEKISSVQTLVNSTGKSTEEIEEYLDALMWYSDETSYGFTDMTKALANMTSTGGNIDKLIPMIRGMANATAFAGKNAADFSRVIYNLNQSYGAGHLQLMDWKSVQLAGVNSKQLTEELIKAGEELGTIKKGQVTIGNFSETLKDKWATTAVMERAFGRFDEFSQAVYQRHLETGEQASVIIRELSKGYDELAVKAFRSVQEAKSFTEAIDATKDAASTGWMTIFTTILGNYDEQKSIFTTFTEWLYDHFVEPVYAVQQVLEDAFNLKKLKAIFNKITDNPITNAIDDINKKIQGSSHTLEEYQNMVRKIWHGDYKNQPYRKALVEAEGYNFAVTQSLVNQTAALDANGQGWKQISKLTEDDVIRLEKEYGISVEQTTENLEEQIKSEEDLLDARLDELVAAKKITQDEADYYRRMRDGAAKYGLEIQDIIDLMEEADARSLIFGRKKKDEHGIDTDEYEVYGVFQNLASFFGNIASAIREAWSETFSEIFGVDLYMAIRRLNEFTAKLAEMTSDETSQGMINVKNAFKGLFSIIKLIATIMNAGFKIGWTIFKTVLQTLGYDVLDFVGNMGLLISKITDFITNNSYLIKGITFLTEAIAGCIIKLHHMIQPIDLLRKIVKKLGDAFRKLADIMKKWYEKTGKNVLHEFLTDLANFFKGMKEADNLPKYIFEGLINGFKKWGGKVLSGISAIFGKIFSNVDKGSNFFEFGLNCVKGLLGGLKSGAGKAVRAFAEWAGNILSAFAGKLKIHSPSKVFFEYGKNIVQGLFNGISSMIVIVYNLLKTIGTKMIEIVKDMDLGSLFVGIVSAGALFGIIKIAGAINTLAKGLSNLNGVIAAFEGVLKSLKGVLNAIKFKLYIESFKSIAISIAILTASIWVMSKIDSPKLWEAFGAIAALMALIGGFLVVVSKFSKIDTVDFAKFALAIIAVAVAMLLIVKALKKVSEIENISGDALAAFGGIMIGIVALTAIVALAKTEVVGMAGTMLAIGIAILLMAKAVKYLGNLKPAVLNQGILALSLLNLMMMKLIAVIGISSYFGSGLKIAGTLLAVGILFSIMSKTIKTLGKLSPSEVAQGLMTVGAIIVLIDSLIACITLANKFGGSESSIAKSLLGIAALILVMGITIRLIGGMSLDKIIKGEAAIAAFVAMIIGLISGLKSIAGQNIASLGLTMLGIAGLIAAMTVSVALLGMLDISKIAKGLIAVGILTLFIIGLVKATEKSRNLGKSLWAFVGAIAVLALSVGLLSIIKPERLVAPMVALGILMLMFGIMVKLAKDVGGQKNTLIGLAAMIGVVAILSGIIVGLSFLDSKGAMSGAIALGALLLALSASLYVLNNIKIDWGNLLPALLGLTVLIGLTALLVYSLGSLSGLDNAEGIIIALGLLMINLSVALLATAGVGAIYEATGGVAATGLLGMLAMIGLTSLMIDVLKKMNTVKNATKNVLLLVLLMNAFTIMLVPLSVLGPLAIVGALALEALIAITPLLVALLAGLGFINDKLPDLEYFIGKGVDLLVLLAKGIGEVLGAFAGGIAEGLSDALPGIGENLSLFATNASDFFDLIGSLTEAHLKGAGILFASILALSLSQLIETLAMIFGVDLPTLGSILTEFVEEAEGYFDGIGKVDSKVLKGSEALAKSILALSVASVIQGFKALGSKETPIETFADNLPLLGTGLKDFAKNIGTFGPDQLKTVETASKAIEALANAAHKMPASGGWAQKICGEQDLEDFADGFPTIGEGIKGFIDEITDDGNDAFEQNDLDLITAGAKAIEILAESAKKLPLSGGLRGLIMGDKDLKDFSKSFPSVGEAIYKFADKIDGSDPEDIKAGAEIIDALANVADLPSDFASKCDEMKEGFPKVGEGLDGFMNALKDIDDADIEKSATHVKSVANIVESVRTGIKTALEMGHEDELGFAWSKFFTDIGTYISESSATFEQWGYDLVAGLCQGIQYELVDWEGSQLQKTCKNLVDGFAKGVEKNKQTAYNAGKTIYNAFHMGLKNEALIESPSRKAMELGSYTAEGFVMGIERYSSHVYNIGEDLSKEAQKGLSSSISKISNLIESDIGNPTIRPILDLSDVANGAGLINSMFTNPSMQVTSNLNDISSTMNSKINNENSDIVSAIDKLGKNLGNSGTTYNINGITYDDNNNINKAVQDLVRAIEVERRV